MILVRHTNCSILITEDDDVKLKPLVSWGMMVLLQWFCGARVLLTLESQQG